jgi:S-formylglutathione hydrolase FrmB
VCLLLLPPHSYFFMASFIEEHVAFHAKHLKA